MVAPAHPRDEMITRTYRSTTAAGALLLLTVTLAACGASSKTSSSTTNASSSKLFRSTAEVPLAPLNGPRSVHARGKFVACMRAHGVKNFPGASTAIKNLDTTSPTFEKASIRCYDSLLRALPEAKLTRPDGSTVDLVPYKVPSGSMEPTLPIGARVYVRASLRHAKGRRHRDLPSSRSGPGG